MIWKQTLDLESLHLMQKNTMSQCLGVRFLEIGADFTAASMPVNAHARQPAGLLHGGAAVTPAETFEASLQSITQTIHANQTL